ncbi:MAG: NifU family protein [Rickettsiaceae bacterium]|nr:NifU family protein [Rickettsiaceae bacterium]
MFIQTEETPNPSALKFFPGSDVSPSGPVFFNRPEEATSKSQLAVKLFNVKGVVAIFYGTDFITITKAEDLDWNLIKPEILMVMMDHLVAGFTIFDEVQEAAQAINTEGMSDIEKQIVEIIETRVRPSVAMDGGDITYQSFKDGIVYLQLRGACSGCPSSSITLKNGIESMLQHFVPEVKGVEASEE